MWCSYDLLHIPRRPAIPKIATKVFWTVPELQQPRIPVPVDDLYSVGAAKPLGYLPLDTIIRAGCEPATTAVDLQGRGLKTRICSGDECSIESGALYVWDHDALRKLMDANRTVLEDAGWPFDADQFVDRVIREHISRNDFPNLYLVIARAFGERV